MDKTTEIWNRYRDELSGYFLSHTGNRELAEDLVQDVFLKLHHQLSQDKLKGKASHWLRRVARNTLIDYWKSKKQVSTVPDFPDESGESEVLHTLAEQCVGEMLKTLPEKYAYALQRCEIDGIKQAQLADELGISLSGAKSLVQRGRIRLKDAIIACCHPQFNSRNEFVETDCQSACGC